MKRKTHYTLVERTVFAIVCTESTEYDDGKGNVREFDVAVYDDKRDAEIAHDVLGRSILLEQPKPEGTPASMPTGQVHKDERPEADPFLSRQERVDFTSGLIKTIDSFSGSAQPETD